MKINMGKVRNFQESALKVKYILICQIMIRDWILLKGRKSFNANILIMQKMMIQGIGCF